MGGGGGKGGSQTTRTENSPPEWAIPLFRQSAEVAQGLYDSNTGFNVYPGSSVADMSKTTLGALNKLGNASYQTPEASVNALTAGTQGRLGANNLSMYNQIGQDARSNPSIGGMQDLASQTGQLGGQFTSNLGKYDDLRKRANDQTQVNNLTGVGERAGGVTGLANDRIAGQGQLEKYARGDFLKEGNPYFQELLNKSVSEATAQTNSMFSGSGRYGSSANQSAVGQNAGDIMLKGLSENFAREQQNQLAASGMLADRRNSKVGNNLAALGLEGQMYGQAGQLGNQGVQTALQTLQGRQGALQNQLGALGQQGNLLQGAGQMYQQGVGQQLAAQQGLNQNQLANSGMQLQSAQTLAGLGNQQFQNEMQANQAQLGAGQMFDRDAQMRLADQIAKFTANDNREWTRLGALQAAAQGSAGQYGTQVSNQQVQQGFNPLGPLGLLGALPLGKSDVRLKTNIERVGRVRGMDIYAFDYVHIPGRYVGVMAQDVLRSRPDAVIMEADGFYAVDYGALGLRMARIA